MAIIELHILSNRQYEFNRAKNVLLLIFVCTPCSVQFAVKQQTLLNECSPNFSLLQSPGEPFTMSIIDCASIFSNDVQVKMQKMHILNKFVDQLYSI